MVKNHFKRARLDHMVSGRPLPLQQAIHDAFRQLTKSKVEAMVARSERLLLDDGGGGMPASQMTLGLVAPVK